MRGLAFLGSKGSGLKALRRLLAEVPAGTVRAILCPDDEADVRSVLPEFRNLAARHKIPLHEKVRKADTIALLRRCGAEIALVHGWYQLIPVDEMPDILCLGFHYSPLPEFRGNAPLVWQILSGRTEIGVSFFQLTAGMDDGPLVDQRTVPLGSNETIGDALEKADILVDDIICAFAKTIKGGNLALRPQPDRRPSYCGLRTPDDGWVDWTWDATRIHDFIRGQTHPYPGAFSRMADGTRLILWSSEVEPYDYMGVSGSVVAVRDDHVVVAAGSGAVRLFSVQQGTEGSTAAPTILRSLRIRLG